MKAINMASARAHLSEVVTKTSTEGESYVIHSRGTPKAVLLGIDEYRSLVATVEEMSDLEAHGMLKSGRDDIKKGKTRTVEEVFGESLL